MTTLVERIRNAELEKQRALAGLHQELGYRSAQDLAQAILDAGRAHGGPSPSKASASAPAAPAASGNSRKGRRVPDATRKAIADALKNGETAALLPKKFGVSYNIVHAIKQTLGMVTARSGKGKKKG
ncbi:MAG TPA: hypothetical protein VHM70_14685 [Polyangiaceae bacterium]|jgi:hypothetical protein|nr:hypothetical protein [Polyangiaceae bacterium]